MNRRKGPHHGKALTSGDRQILTPQFGHQLTRMRGTQSRSAVCRALQSQGISLDRSTLLQYERGTVRAPDPAVLWGLTRHYGLDTIEHVIGVLVSERTNRPVRDIAISPFDAQQRAVAEIFGDFSPELKRAVWTILRGLQDTFEARQTQQRVG